MVDEWQRLISIFSNAFGAVTEFLMLVLALLLLIQFRGRLSRATVEVSTGLALLGLGGLFRIGWWLPALFLTREHEAYHVFFIEQRWISYAFGMPLMTVGITLILSNLFEAHRKQFWLALLGGFLLSVAITYSYHLSEVGVWDRAVLIDLWDSVFPYDSAFERVIIRGEEK